MSPELLILAGAAFFLGGAIKGLIGIGLPIVVISILSQAVDPRTAIALVLVPMLATNAWQVLRAGAVGATIRRYLPFIAALVITILLTARESRNASAEVILLFVGSAIILYSSLSLTKLTPTLPAKFDLVWQLLFGALAGVLGGLTAIWAPPMVLYLTSRRLSKTDFIRGTGLLITAGSIPLVAGYVMNGFFQSDVALTSSLMVIPAVLGFYGGERLRARVNTDQFYAIVMVLFLIMGAMLVWRSLGV